MSYDSENHGDVHSRALSSVPAAAVAAFLAFFFVTLESYGNVSLALAACFATIYLLLSFRVRFRRRAFQWLFLFILAYLALVMLSQFEALTFKHNIPDYPWYVAFASMSLKIFSASIITLFAKRNLRQFVIVLKVALITHVSMFYLQFLVAHGTGYYIDPLVIVTNEEQRYQSGVVVPLIGQIYRATGFYNEPSLYATFCIAMLFMLVHFTGRIGKIFVLSLMSVFMTFSFSAVLSGAVFAFFIYWGYIQSRMKRIASLFCLASILLPFFFVSLARVDSIDSQFSPLLIRANLVVEVFQQSALEVLLGNGPLGIPTTFGKYLRGDSLLDAGLASFPDAGTWLYLIMKFGIAGLMVYLVVMYRSIRNLSLALAFGSILLTKMNFFYVFFITMSAMLVCVQADLGRARGEAKCR